MNWKTILVGAALVAATAFITAQVVSQDAPTPPDRGHDLTEAEMMEKWMEFMTPGENHHRLRALVGKWEQEVRFWHGPDMEANTSSSTAEYKAILGGRFVKGTYRGSVMGMDFEGVDITGYDNLRKEYVSIWMDNMSTAIMITRGQFDSEQNALIMTGTYDDPATGERDKPVRTVTRMDGDRASYEMYMQSPQGEPFKNLEVQSKRKDQ